MENLIDNFHKMAPFATVVGTLPWIIRPILESSIGRKLFMPNPAENTGAVSIGFHFPRTLKIHPCPDSQTLQFRDRLLEERLNDPKTYYEGDFLDNILAAKNENRTSITTDDVKIEGFVLMVAASETIAAFFYGFVRFVF